MGLLDGKKGLILNVANDRSIAWHIGHNAIRHGATCGFGYLVMGDADKSRQQLLFFTQSRVPPVLWGVIYVGAFLLFLLIAMHYAGRPAGRLVALGSVVTLLTVVVAVLSMLDQPYGAGARVGPSSLEHAIELLKTGPGAASAFEPCSTPASE